MRTDTRRRIGLYERRQVAYKVLAGMWSVDQAVCATGYSVSSIRRWVRLVRQYGENGLEP